MEIFTPGRIYDFMKLRAASFAFSGILVLAALVLMVYPGPRYGTDFRGGTEVEIAFRAPIDAARIRAAAQAAGFPHPEVVEIANPGTPNRFLIRVQEVSSLDGPTTRHLLSALCAEGTEAPPTGCADVPHPTEVKLSPGGDRVTLRYETPPDLDRIRRQIGSVERVELREGRDNPRVVSARDNKVEVALKSKGDLLAQGLRAQLGPDLVPETPERIEWLGPKAGKQLRNGALKSVGLSILFIMAYIAVRFDLRFAPGGILALVHDTLVLVGAFIALRREFTLSTIAAILTVVGYSIADKVIVYDRIRENLRGMRSERFDHIINVSVSETLSRTVLTSGTVLLSMTMFFVWGSGILRDFALALVIGVLTATYSSIFVAAPLTELIDRRFFRTSVARRTAPGPVKRVKRGDPVV